MEVEAVVAWALDPARTIEERYTLELLVESGVGFWNARHNVHVSYSLEDSMARSRERKLNPAYDPHYSEENLRKAVEHLEIIEEWRGSSDRPVRSLEPLRFLTSLQSLAFPFDEPDDLSPLADLPLLRKLALGYPGSTSYNKSCVDFTPL